MITSTESLKAGQSAEVDINLIDSEDRYFCLRQTFKAESITKSLEELGQINPIVVRIKGRRLQIVAGWRRYMGLQAAGAKSLRIEIIDKSDSECRLISAAENFDRDDMTAGEKYRCITGLLKDGLKTTDLMEKLGWKKSYANAVKHISAVPAVVKALDEDKFKSISTAAELAEQITGKHITDPNQIKKSISKTVNGTWPVNDIGRYLIREKEICERQPDQPPLSDDLIESSGNKKSRFTSKWQNTWSRQKLIDEKRRFEAEIKRISEVIKKKGIR